MNIDLLHLRRAQAVAESKSFAKAAKELHISQPALSRSIQELEARIGTPVFYRKGGTVELTDAGRHLLSSAAEIIRRTDDLVRELHLYSDLGNGELVVGAGLFPADLLLGGAIARFSRQRLPVRVRVVIDNWLNLGGLVRKGQVDLAVAEVSSIEDDPELKVSLQQRFQGYFAVKPGHPLLGKASLTMSDVTRYPIVAPSQLPARFVGGLLKAAATNLGRGHDLQSIQPSIACDSGPLIRGIVAQSEAVGLVTASLVADDVSAGKLALLPLEEPWNWGTFGLVQLAGRNLSTVAKTFVACLEEALRERMLLEESARARLVGCRKPASRRTAAAVADG